MNSSWKKHSNFPPIFELMLEVVVIHEAAWRAERKRVIFQLKHSVSKSQKRGRNARLSSSVINLKMFSFFPFWKRKRKKRRTETLKVYVKIETAFKNELVLYSQRICITNENWRNLSIRLTDTVWEIIFPHMLSEKEFLIQNQVERRSGITVLSNCGCLLSTESMSASVTSRAGGSPASCSQSGELSPVRTTWEKGWKVGFKIYLTSEYLQGQTSVTASLHTEIWKGSILDNYLYIYIYIYISISNLQLFRYQIKILFFAQSV